MRTFFLWATPHCLWVFITVANAAPYVVIVDPGHGGKDRGAIAKGLQESKLVLSISELLASKLNRDKNFHALLTRSTDSYLTLNERTQFAHQNRGDLFLSVHLNWSTDPRAHGVEIYFRNQLPPDQESMFLAARENLEDVGSANQTEYSIPGLESLEPEVATIVRDLTDSQRVRASSVFSKSLLNAWRGQKKSKSLSIKQAPFFVIKNLDMPANLVELGFLSHGAEADLIGSPKYQEIIAQSLYDGIVQFKDSMDKTP